MHLLVIEDEETLARNMTRLLEARGFVVDSLSEGKKTFGRLCLYRELYSLVILDLGLPDIDGTDLIAQIRAEGIVTPIIVLTGRSDTESKVHALNTGADDYIVKPFSTEELVARINSVLRRPVPLKPATYELGDLSIDTTTHRVYFDGGEIPLTQKEYSLFECLMRRPHEVVTRSELAEGAWDFDSVNWSNVLDVHMKNLRKKLDRAKALQIETVRGIGYRLLVE